MSPHNARHVVGSTLRAKLYVHSLIPGCTVRCLSCCDYYISSHDVLFSGARVRRLATHPTEQSWVVSAVQGNNEVTVWDLETGARRQALWASHTPPLSQTQVCYRKLLLIRSQPRSQGSLLGENPGNEVDKIWAFTSNVGAYIRGGL